MLTGWNLAKLEVWICNKFLSGIFKLIQINSLTVQCY